MVVDLLLLLVPSAQIKLFLKKNVENFQKKEKKKHFFSKEKKFCEGKVKNPFETFGFTKMGKLNKLFYLIYFEVCSLVDVVVLC